MKENTKVLEKTSEDKDSNEPVVIKKKRGRKPKKKSPSELEEVKVPKKRGRKPKGGKIIEKSNEVASNNNILPNIILHLKCKKGINENISEFNYNPTMQVPESFNISNSKHDCLNYEEFNNKTQDEECENFKNVDNNNKKNENNYNIDDSSNSTYKELWFKLKELQIMLHNNNNKHSACFWCTCDFDNPPIFIPKHYINEHYEVYGCFCSPECACSFLMNENIDSSIKFERYHLLNHIYSKIYNYTKNIKPAPNPYYLLKKFCGNLSINDYRSLNSTSSLLLVIDKPLTRIMPELHEDNISSSTSNNNDNNLLLKRNSTKKKKVNIVSENFGF